tara:strand:- start:3493 stop:4221 length:729 start_codon:yes stop_codon:yes gene_type:complete
MATEFFKNFPEIGYKLSNGKTILIKDFFRKSKIEQEAVNQIIEYSLYQLEEGERPDVAATKIYGNPHLHWTFFLVNDLENYYDWHKDSVAFEKYIDKKYPGQLAIASQSTDILSRKATISDNTNKFLLGEKVTSISGEGRVVLVEPAKNRIAIDGKGFVANETITGKVSTRSFVPTSVIDHRDGVAYYKNGNLRKNTESSGFTAVTMYDDEFEKNEAKRSIKIISPQALPAILRKFEQIMSA